MRTRLKERFGKVTNIAVTTPGDVAAMEPASLDLIVANSLIQYLKRGELPEVVLNNLYKQTQLQDTFGMNMVALIDGQPRLLNLKDMIGAFLSHRREVVTRRTVFELREARAPATCWKAWRWRWPTSTSSSRSSRQHPRRRWPGSS